jgi:glycopeptide antibiotics resistance protein
VSLVPLRDLATMSTFQVAGNLLLLAPLGFLAPVRFQALRSVPRVTALAAMCSVLIETAQYVLPLDRVSSVDDVLLNATGAGAAASVSVALLRGMALLRWRADRARVAADAGT